MGKSATTFHSQGSPLRPFRGAPPTEHFKNHDSALVVVSILPSLVLLFFWAVQYGQAIDPQNLPLSRQRPATKFWAETPPGHPE